MSRRNLPYGKGTHGVSWATAVAAGEQDCSSSVSTVLYQAGLMNGFGGPIVSGDFNTWGVEGYGHEMTVYYNAGHVFLVFYGRAMQRFDTVGLTRGPHLREGAPPEPDAMSMGKRHWSGF